MSETPPHGTHAERIAHRIKRIKGAHERHRQSHAEAAAHEAAERAAAHTPPADAASAS